MFGDSISLFLFLFILARGLEVVVMGIDGAMI